MSDQKTKLLDNPRFKQFMNSYSLLEKSSEGRSLDEGRKMATNFFLPSDTVYETVHKIENITITGRDHTQIPLRIYIPTDSKTLRVIVYYHRGGWVFGNIEEADPVCRKLANHTNSIVVSIDYRLAPENPFPKPFHDCQDAMHWVYDHINKFTNSHKIIVCGESAGGNLAAAVALAERDENKSKISAQVLIYPVITSTIPDAPYKHSADQYFLTKNAMKFFWSMYLQSPEHHKNPYASPDFSASFKNLPPAIIITAEHDPLHDEAEAYANQLKAAGVNVKTKCFPEVIHGFIDLPIYDEKEKIEWINEIGKLLNQIVE